MRARLLLFTRYPTPGKVKTRLIPALGPDGAAELHRLLVSKALGVATELRSGFDCRITVCYTGAPQTTMAQWLGRQDFWMQRGADLGQRMANAVRRAVDLGDRRVVVIGSDCPGLTPGTLRQAFDALTTHEVALGPAHDGGYYLIGLRGRQDALFSGIDWGTSNVLAQTIARIRAHGLNHALLPKLTDIDRPDDLESLRHHPDPERSGND